MGSGFGFRANFGAADLANEAQRAAENRLRSHEELPHAVDEARVCQHVLHLADGVVDEGDDLWEARPREAAREPRGVAQQPDCGVEDAGGAAC